MSNPLIPLVAGVLRAVALLICVPVLTAQGVQEEVEEVLEEIQDLDGLRAALMKRKAAAAAAAKAGRAGAASAAEGKKLRSRRITGQVVDGDGKPIPGVGVILGGPKTVNTMDCLRAPRATTDAEGRYAFELEPALVAPKPIKPPVAKPEPGPAAPLDEKEAEALRLEIGKAVRGEFLDAEREAAAKLEANKAAIAAAKADAERRKLVLYYGPGLRAVARSMPSVDHTAVDTLRPAKTDEEQLLAVGTALLAQAWGHRATPSEDEVVLPKVTLRPGRNLRGRIVDDAGQPIPGVRLQVKDLFTSSRFTGVTRSKVLVSYATSGPDGSFELPGIAPRGGVLTATAKGYFDVSVDLVGQPEWPLRMGVAKEVVGRVVVDGAPKLPSVRLVVRYEVSSTSQSLKVEKDGSFRFFPKHPHRFRVTATPSSSADRKKYLAAYSPVLSGPPEKGLVLRLAVRPKPKPKPKVAKRKPIITRQQRLAKIGMGVGVVDARTGRPLTDFRAGISWVSKNTSVQLASYASRASRMKVKPGKQAGYVRLPGPSVPDVQGVLMVTAPGYVNFVAAGIPFRPGDATGFRAEMVPESILAGRVVDKATGKPIVGAQIRAAQTDARRGPLCSYSAKTNAQGEFRIGGVGEGAYTCTASYGSRPSEAVKLDLREEEFRGDLRFEIGHGVSLRGTVQGIEIGDRWKVELLSQSYANYFFSGSSYRPSGRRVELSKDGAFEFKDVGAGEYEVGLVIPREAPQRGEMRMPVEPVKIGKSDLEVTVDASEDHPGRIVGKLELSGAEIDPARLLVVCSFYQPSYYYGYYSSYVNLSGTRSDVGKDGSFSFREMAGKYQLKVYDLRTGVLMLQTRAPIELAAGQTRVKNLSLEVTEVTVHLKPADEGGQVVASWLNLLVQQPMPEMWQMFGFFGGSYGRRPTGISLRGHRTGEPIKLLLPNHKTQIQVYSDVGVLSRARKRPSSNLGEADVEAGRKIRSEIEITVAVPTTGFEPEPEKKPVAAVQEDR